MIFICAITAVFGVILGAMIWIFISAYQSQKEWSSRHENYQKAQKVCENLYFSFRGTAIDAMRLRISDERVVDMNEYAKLNRGDVDKMNRFGARYGEYVSGTDYFQDYEYYYLVSADPNELLTKLRNLVNENMETIQEASIYWGPILKDMEGTLKSLACEDTDHPRASILGFYWPITKEQFNTFKNTYTKMEARCLGKRKLDKLPKIEFNFHPFTSENEGFVRDALQKKVRVDHSGDEIPECPEKEIMDDET